MATVADSIAGRMKAYLARRSRNSRSAVMVPAWAAVCSSVRTAARSAVSTSAPIFEPGWVASKCSRASTVPACMAARSSARGRRISATYGRGPPRAT